MRPSYVKYVLDRLGEPFNSQAAVQLDFRTGIQESLYRHVYQISGGPGRGFWQIEPDTANDIIKNYLSYRPEIGRKIDAILGTHKWWNEIAPALTYSVDLGIIMCRLKYRMIPAPLPEFDDLQGQAEYWDKYYNANPEYGTPQEFIENVRRYEG